MKGNSKQKIVEEEEGSRMGELAPTLGSYLLE
jgi:hypothetical protein